MKIVYTNWINIVGVFATLFIYTTISGLIDPNVSRNFLQAIIASLIGLVLYGLIFWIGFILSLTILDFILIIPNQKSLKSKLLVEWLIISSPFIFWAIKYEEQRLLYLLAIVTFLITQLLRLKLILKVAKKE
jgi:hypothetical protein